MAMLLRKIGNIRQEVEHRANSETEGAGYLKGSYGVFDVVQNVIDVRPSGVSIQHLERRCRVLGEQAIRTKEQASIILI